MKLLLADFTPNTRTRLIIVRFSFIVKIIFIFILIIIGKGYFNILIQLFVRLFNYFLMVKSSKKTTEDSFLYET